MKKETRYVVGITYNNGALSCDCEGCAYVSWFGEVCPTRYSINTIGATMTVMTADWDGNGTENVIKSCQDFQRMGMVALSVVGKAEEGSNE